MLLRVMFRLPENAFAFAVFTAREPPRVAVGNRNGQNEGSPLGSFFKFLWQEVDANSTADL